MYGDCFYGRDAYCSLDFAEAIEFELVDLCELFGVLPVVLHYVDVVGDCEEAGEGGGFGVPEGGGDDALKRVVLVCNDLYLGGWKRVYRIV